jgi:uncharacterized integral membrane protein (TIGR00697 family)
MSPDQAQADIDIRQKLYLFLTCAFVTALVVADIIGGKFVSIGPVTLPVGLIPFPITFLLTDLINEYYGSRAARRVTYIGLVMAGFSFLMIFLARHLPVSPKSPLPQDVYDQVFGASNRLYIASLTAYLLGQLSDIYIFTVLKRLSKGKLLWLRATGSTVISQGIDSFTVAYLQLSGVTLADGSTASFQYILQIFATGYTIKFFIAVGLTPLIYTGHEILHYLFKLKPLAVDEDR